MQKFFDNPRAIIPFILKRIYYNHVADSYLKDYKDFNYLPPKETLNHIIDNNLSLIRFGDGSFDIIMGFSIYFNGWRQKYNKTLADKLTMIMRSKKKTILLCFTVDFILKPKSWFVEQGEEIGYYSWVFSKLLLRRIFSKDTLYGSSLCFYPKYNTDIDYKKLQHYFASKHIVIVASNVEKFTNMQLGKTTHFVAAPGSDAWQSYEGIKKETLKLITEKSLPKEEVLVLTSMAEAAKVLVYELDELGYRAWDTGQFFDMASKEINKLTLTA